MKVFFVFLFSVFGYDEALYALGHQRIKTTMYLADDWREFHVHWNWNAWPEDVLDKLSNHVQIDGFAPITWAKRRNDQTLIGNLDMKLNGAYDTFYFRCVNETAFRGLKLYE